MLGGRNEATLSANRECASWSPFLRRPLEPVTTVRRRFYDAMPHQGFRRLRPSVKPAPAALTRPSPTPGAKLDGSTVACSIAGAQRPIAGRSTWEALARDARCSNLDGPESTLSGPSPARPWTPQFGGGQIDKDLRSGENRESGYIRMSTELLFGWIAYDAKLDTRPSANMICRWASDMFEIIRNCPTYSASHRLNSSAFGFTRILSSLCMRRIRCVERPSRRSSLGRRREPPLRQRQVRV